MIHPLPAHRHHARLPVKPVRPRHGGPRPRARQPGHLTPADQPHSGYPAQRHHGRQSPVPVIPRHSGHRHPRQHRHHGPARQAPIHGLHGRGEHQPSGTRRSSSRWQAAGMRRHDCHRRPCAGHRHYGHRRRQPPMVQRGSTRQPPAAAHRLLPPQRKPKCHGRRIPRQRPGRCRTRCHLGSAWTAQLSFRRDGRLCPARLYRGLRSSQLCGRPKSWSFHLCHGLPDRPLQTLEPVDWHLQPVCAPYSGHQRPAPSDHRAHLR